MGKPIALRLQANGHRLSCHDKDASRTSGLPEVGSVSDAAQGSEALLLCLPDAPHVEAVVEELLRAAQLPAVLIDLTSSDPDMTLRLGRQLGERGCALLDAPMSGGVPGAETGELVLMVGGDQEVFEGWRQLLEQVGREVVYAGPPGSGHRLKALNNGISGACMVAACELLALAGAEGLDLERALTIVNASSGRSEATRDKYPRAVLSGTWNVGFDFATILKDMTRARGLARQVGVSAPLTSVSTEIVRLAAGEAGLQADFSLLAKVYDGWAAASAARPSASHPAMQGILTPDEGTRKQKEG